MNNINTAFMLPKGTILHGTYRIESHLSSGGFGNTYKVTNIEFDETYAVKEFFLKGFCHRIGNSAIVCVSNSENVNGFAQQKEKFKKEARRLRRLDNPHIVKVYDLFEENNTAYYVMDYVEGENLDARLARAKTPLSESVVSNYLYQILDGLQAVHAEGMWHLDIKPANIMVDNCDNVKLIDFGASKQQSLLGGATTSTAICYTYGYAPSEQMAQSYDKFGPWTDFYALGATLFKLLTRQDPPSVTDISEDESEDKCVALPMLSLSANMKTLIVWMMQVNRQKRPKCVEEIKEFLEKKSSVANCRNGAILNKSADAVKGNDQVNVVLKEKTASPQTKNATGGVKWTTSESPSREACYIVGVLLFALFVFICSNSLSTLGRGDTPNSISSADSDTIMMVDSTVDTIPVYTDEEYQDYSNVDNSSSKVTYIGEFNGETWELVENPGVYLETESKKYSLSDIDWGGGEKHLLLSVNAVKMYMGKIWFIANDFSAESNVNGVQVFNYDIKNDMFEFVMNCKYACFSGKTIQYEEAYLQEDGDGAKEDVYGYTRKTLNL